MYNNYMKLTEKHTRDKTRTVYVNLDRVDMIAETDGVSRLFIGSKMIDVVETPAHILSIEQIVITDKDELNERDRNENGRVDNPA